MIRQKENGPNAQHRHVLMLRHHPKSFLKLILTGFLLVAIPLFLALAYSAVSINRLAYQSRQAVYQAERIAHDSRILVDQVTIMERSVRLALILGDPSMLDAYRQAHAEFGATVASLASLPLNEAQKRQLEALRSMESSIHLKVGNTPLGQENLTTLDFSPLTDSAQSFLRQGEAPVEREVEEMQAMADRARQVVLWQLLALIPLAAGLAFGFSWLINRPIRQIEKAIRIMGRGELSKPVQVDGPEDLKRLGDSLNWMRTRLLDVEEQKTRFLQHVSHELKTPLTSIREGADLLAGGMIGSLNAKQQQTARILLGNSVELQKRIEDLLNYSAIQSGQSAAARVKCDLGTLLEKVLKDQHLAIMNKSLNIDLDCPETVLECDEQKIAVVLDNLLSNAVKFSPQGGTIEISARRTDGNLQLDFADSGPGVEAVDRERIFEAFYQGRRTRQGPTTGTGLGLAIAREYVHAHGGALELVESEKGARFRVTLPIAPRTAP